MEGLEAKARSICLRLRAAGHQALYVGGFVRDRLLGLQGATEIDIATSAPPEAVQALFPQTYAVGARFGVVVVVLEGTSFEVATFRSDEAYVDGRRPTGVRFATVREDALRRDFTVNALFQDPVSGETIDPVGGRADLEARLIRAVGDPAARFREDHLRLVRAVRFAARLGFAIEAGTLEAIRASAPQAATVSGERLRDELLKMLAHPSRRRALELLDEAGLLPVVLPECAPMKGCLQPPEFHPEGDVWVHTLLLIDQLDLAREEVKGRAGVLALAGLLHDVGKPPTFVRAPDRIRFDGHTDVGARMAEEIGRRLRLSNDDREAVVELVRDHLRFIECKRMRQSTLKRFLRAPLAPLHLELHRADCLACHGDLSAYRFCRERLEAWRAEAAADALRPPRLVTGDDLLAAGLRAGPRFKEILEAIEDAQLEGAVKTREEALALALARFPPP